MLFDKTEAICKGVKDLLQSFVVECLQFSSLLQFSHNKYKKGKLHLSIKSYKVCFKLRVFEKVRKNLR